MDDSPRQDILADLLAGDREAHKTVRRWVQSVVRFQRWRFRDPQGLEQDILLKLLNIARARRYRPGPTMRGFVQAVAEHTCIDAYRSEFLRRKVELNDRRQADRPTTDGNPEETRSRRERLQRIRYIFQRLSTRCRELWLLVYGDGLSAREVAGRLGISPGNVRVRVHRCLQEARRLARQIVPGGAGT